MAWEEGGLVRVWGVFLFFSPFNFLPSAHTHTFSSYFLSIQTDLYSLSFFFFWI